LTGSLGGTGAELVCHVARLGVTALLGIDSGLAPMEPFAVTVNVYVVPFVRPLKVADVPASPVVIVATAAVPTNALMV
jgi:hypothetical protein